MSTKGIIPLIIPHRKDPPVLFLGIILLVVGCIVAIAVERTVGVIIALVGAVLVIVALVDVSTAEAVIALGRSWS